MGMTKEEVQHVFTQTDLMINYATLPLMDDDGSFGNAGLLITYRTEYNERFAGTDYEAPAQQKKRWPGQILSDFRQNSIFGAAQGVRDVAEELDFNSRQEYDAHCQFDPVSVLDRIYESLERAK